jgi:uncharacterized protein YdaL
VLIVYYTENERTRKTLKINWWENMSTKPFQIKMAAEAHKRLKERANQLDFTIGKMIENLLASFELRVLRARKRIEENEEIDSIYKDSSLDARIMKLIFTKDRDELTDKQYNKEIKKLVDTLTGETWQPKIKI